MTYPAADARERFQSYPHASDRAIPLPMPVKTADDPEQRRRTTSSEACPTASGMLSFFAKADSQKRREEAWKSFLNMAGGVR